MKRDEKLKQKSHVLPELSEIHDPHCQLPGVTLPQLAEQSLQCIHIDKWQSLDQMGSHPMLQGKTFTYHPCMV